MKELLLVSIGSFFGGGMRFWISKMVQSYTFIAFPFGTMTVNVLGCLIIGFLSGLNWNGGGLLSPSVKMLLTTGFCGGFTTFSTFMNEGYGLMKDGSYTYMNSLDTNNIKWSENVIIADADYIDRVAFDLTVNFERMINRRIQPADMAQWAVCIALDGGLREGEHETQVVLIHDKQSMAMKNFRPSNYEKDLNAQAFKDNKLGEFIISSYPTEEKMVGKDDFLVDVARTVCNAKEVKRVMIIPNSEDGDAYDRLREILRKVEDDDKRITLFAMQPMPGGNFRQEILGYSLMSALGISANEIK